ncbi:MAG: hypothetical protein HY962_13065 [Ignavibacteriae bacterium]|nr:hypothetical protein [Ignavibacteriota bacterium]
MNGTRNTAVRAPGGRVGILAAVAAVLMLAAGSLHAQGGGDVKSKMQKAMEYYNNAYNDEAIQLLSELTQNAELAKDDKVNVYLILSRCYFAKDMTDKSKWALAQLASLAPPRPELDPENEAPQLVKMYYSVCKEATGSAAIERPDPGMQTIAILDFKNRLVGDDVAKYTPLENGFADLMIAQLNGLVNLKVVERERIAWILQEIGLENDPGKFDQNTAVRVGKQLGVNAVLFGSYIGFPGKMKLSTRLVKVETGEILATEVVSGDVDDFDELTAKLSTLIAKKINVTVTEKAAQEKSPTQSLDAMLFYADGVTLVEKGDYRSALEKFQQALSLDPGFEKAKKRIEVIKPLIG